MEKNGKNITQHNGILCLIPAHNSISCVLLPLKIPKFIPAFQKALDLVIEKRG